MKQEQESPKLNEVQVRRLLSDLQKEVTRVELIKKTAEHRARRYNEITSRAKFLKKSHATVERDLRRLYMANRYVDSCVEALNQLNAQVTQYTQQLEAVA